MSQVTSGTSKLIPVIDALPSSERAVPRRRLNQRATTPEAITGPVAASVAAAVLAYERGASLFRAHDVREHVQGLTIAGAVTS